MIPSLPQLHAPVSDLEAALTQNTDPILLSDKLEILAEWFCDNLRMPSAREKVKLGFLAGLDPHQVHNWMSNTRRRLLSRAQAGKNPQSLLEYRIWLAVAASQ
jgi:hypothetical protein